MSLDVYLTMPDAQTISGGIFVREDGRTKQITDEEWNARNPEREPVRTLERETNEVFEYNITHNPDNGWGNYEGLRDFVAAYLDAAIEWPDAEIQTST